MSQEMMSVVHLVGAYGRFALAGVVVVTGLWLLVTALVPNRHRRRRRITVAVVALPVGAVSGFLWARSAWWEYFHAPDGSLTTGTLVLATAGSLAVGAVTAWIVWKAPATGWSRGAATARDLLCGSILVMLALMGNGWSIRGTDHWLPRVASAALLLPPALALAARSVRRSSFHPRTPTRSATFQAMALSGVLLAGIVVWSSLPHRMVGPAGVELAGEPSSADTAVDVRISYPGCSNGEVPDVDDVAAVHVDEAPDLVLIGVDVRYPPSLGAYTCEGTSQPPLGIAVPLEGPVGDRDVRPTGPYEPVVAEQVCLPRSTSTIPLPPDASTLATTPPDAPLEEGGFLGGEPEVRYVASRSCLSEVDALAIANVQLLTGALATDISVDHDGNVTDLRFMIGGRDDEVAEGEVLIRVVARDPDDQALQEDLAAFDALGARALQLAAQQTGGLGIVHATAEARLVRGDFAHVWLVRR